MMNLSLDDVLIETADKRKLVEIDQFQFGSGLVAITGQNGIGKSTFLRTIVGVHRLSRGHVRLDDIDSRTQRQSYLRNIAYQPQNFAAYPNLTALEFLTYFQRLRGHGAGDARRSAAAWLQRVGLSEHSAQRTGTFSQGMLQRLGLAYVLQTNAPVYVLDEPFAGVDPAARATLTDLLAEEARSRIVLLCTHHVDEVSARGATVVEISDQRLHRDGGLSAR
jgi:ABC-2 type transport system ATP-binding protein